MGKVGAWIFAIVLVMGALPCVQAGPALLIDHVTLIDGTGRSAVPDTSVLIVNGRIERIERGTIDTPGGTHRIRGAGRYLVPGLFDVHIHLQGGFERTPDGKQRAIVDREAGLRALHGYLYSGVTSVFDAGNNPDHIYSLRKAERAGEIVAPRIYAAGGVVTYPGSHDSSEVATLVDDWPEAIPLLEAHIAYGPDMVKLTYEERGWGARPMIPILPPELMQRIIEWYNDRGVRSTAHTAGELRAREAIFAGVDTLAHPVITGPISEGFARLMAAKQIPMATTLTIGDNYSRLVEHPEYLDQPLYRAALPPEEIERLRTEVRAEWKDRQVTAWMRVMIPIAQENLRQIHVAGGVLALGSDQSIGPAVHREMELLVAAGIAPLDVIRIATLNSAMFLGNAHDYGSIEEGKVADLVLLEADPSEDIDNAKRITEVIKGGVIVDRESLAIPVVR